MKKENNASATPLPTITSEEVEKKILKGKTINFRLSLEDKEDIAKTASALKLSVSEYLIKCHQLVMEKVEKS